MKKQDIISAINLRVGTDYKIWTIGITDTPNTRTETHKNDGNNVDHWQQWATDSEQDGRDIEKHFLDKEMKGGTGGDTGAKYVYIF